MLNTSFLEVMISSKNERVFSRALSNLILQIMFLACQASMSLGSNRPVTWINPRHAPLWCFHSQCKLSRLAALASYVPFVIKIFAIHQKMGAAQWGTAWWREHITK